MQKYLHFSLVKCLYALVFVFAFSTANSQTIETLGPGAGNYISNSPVTEVATSFMTSVGNFIPLVAYTDAAQGGKLSVRSSFLGQWSNLGSGISTGAALSPSIARYWFDNSPYVIFADASNGNKATIMKCDYNGTSWAKHTSTYPVSNGKGILSRGAATNTALYGVNQSFYAHFCDAENGNKITVLVHGADYGKIFTPDVWLDAGTASTGPASEVKMDIIGYPTVIYADGNYGNKATVRRLASGNQWNLLGNEGFSLGAVKFTSIASLGGITYVAYTDVALGNVPVIKKYNPTTNSWDQAGNSLPAHPSSHTVIAASTSSIYLSYTDSLNANTLVVYKLNTSTNNWDRLGKVPFPANSFCRAIIIDLFQNYLNVVYSDASRGNRLFMKSFTSEWQFAGKFNSAGKAGNLSITRGGVNTPSIAFSDAGVYNKGFTGIDLSGTYNTTNTYPYIDSPVGRTSICSFNKRTYMAARDLSSKKIIVKTSYSTTIGDNSTSPDSADYPVLAADDASIWLGYQDMSNKKITVKRLNSAGTVWEIVGNPAFAEGTDVSMAIHKGIPYVSFTDISGGNSTSSVRVMRLNSEGTNWETVANGSFPMAKAGYNSIDFAGSKAYVAYQDLANGSKVTVKRLNSSGTEWETSGSAAFSAGKAEYISIAVNGITPFVIYQDHTKNKKVSIKRLRLNTNNWESVGDDELSFGESDYTTISSSGANIFFAYNDEGAALKKFASGLPTIDTFSPQIAPYGTTVTITGTNLGNVSSVKFGGIPAASYTINSANSITAVVGNGRSGTITVTTSTDITEKEGFTFTPIANISSFSPVYAAAGTKVTIRGSKFLNVSEVTFGGKAAKSFNAESDSVITAILGEGSSGVVAVTATGGTAEKEGFTFIPAPEILTITPKATIKNGTVTILGSNFNNVSAVKFGGVSAASFTVHAPDSITAIVGSGASGDVEVLSEGGTASLSGFSFYATPSITSFTPVSAGAGSTISITGSNFGGTTSVTVGGTSVKSFNVNSSTSISLVLSNGSSGSISVTNPAGTAIKTGFTFVPAPIISSFSPASAAAGSKIIILGSNFSGVKSINFGSISSTSFIVNSSTSITVTVPVNASSGSISVTTSGGTTSLAGFIFLAAPDIDSFTPISAGAKTAVTITGTNFTGATSVKFGGTNAFSFTVNSPTSITAIVASGTSGTVSVSTIAGTGSIGGFNFIAAPGVSSFSPVAAGEGSKVTISGSNFSGATSVSFGGTPAASYIVNSANSITATIAAGSSGNVSVITPGGSGSKAGFSFVEEATINSFFPTSAATGNTVIISGTNFIGVTSVKFGGQAATSFRVLSPTSISAVVATGTSGNITINTTSGTVSAPGFTFIQAPTISSFYPASAAVGGMITISGSNLSNATNVKFGEVSAASFTVNSSNSITAVVGAGKTGAVSVVTPGGTASRNTFSFIAAPLITSFVPSIATTNTKVSISGTNFSNVKAVSFGGTPAASFVVNSSTKITAVVAAGSSGAVSVTAAGGTSEKGGFLFTKNQVLVSSGSSVFEYQNLDNPGSSAIVYPNPFETVLIINLPNDVVANTASVKILSVTGTKVFENNFEVINKTIGLNLENLLSGYYYITVNTDNREYKCKVMKK